MSDTPETDEAVKASNGQWSFVLKETCQRLERERDEALELVSELKRKISDYCDEQLRLVFENRRLHQERDEALEALENHMASTVHSCSDECKRPMCVLRRQRDDAREMVKAICKNKFGTNCEFIDDDE